MMTVKNKYFFYALFAIFITSAALIISFRIFTAVSYPEKVISSHINNLFKYNFNRAVKFEDIDIRFPGTIVLHNFNISVTSDFNDNLSMIRSGRTLIRLRISDLLHNKFTVRSIEFERADIVFEKRYIDNYSAFYDTTVKLLDSLEKDSPLSSGKVKVRFYNSNIFYRELLNDKKICIQCIDVNAKAVFYGERLEYTVRGVIRPNANREISKGTLKFSGILHYRDGKKNLTRAVIDNFDLSYLNNFITRENHNFQLRGGCSIEADAVSLNSLHSVTAAVETNNLHVLCGKSMQLSPVSNENVNIDFNIDFTTDFRHILCRNFSLSDDILSLAGSGEYTDNDSKHALRVSYNIEDVDLGELSRNISILKDSTYKGWIKATGNCDIDFRNRNVNRLDNRVTLRDFSLTAYRNGTGKVLFSDAGGAVSSDRNIVSIALKADFDGSDLSVKGSSAVKTWFPLCSDSEISIHSRKIRSQHLFSGAAYLIDRIYMMALRDRKRGYEEIFFLSKPASAFINHNNCSLTIAADRISMGERAHLDNFKSAFLLSKGVLLLNNFNLDGYGGLYELKFLGLFNRDYPYVSLEGVIYNLDLDSISSDLGSRCTLGGNLYCNFDYKVTAYRLSHIIENAEGAFHISGLSGSINNTGAQNRINAFLHKNGYPSVDIRTIIFNNASVTVSQLGENFYFRNISLEGEGLSIKSYGKYTYTSGLDVPFFAGLRDKNKRALRIPFILSGPLRAPCLGLRNSIKAGNICF